MINYPKQSTAKTVALTLLLTFAGACGIGGNSENNKPENEPNFGQVILDTQPVKTKTASQPPEPAPPQAKTIAEKQKEWEEARTLCDEWQIEFNTLPGCIQNDFLTSVARHGDFSMCEAVIHGKGLTITSGDTRETIAKALHRKGMFSESDLEVLQNGCPEGATDCSNRNDPNYLYDCVDRAMDDASPQDCIESMGKDCTFG